jgi:acetyl/propionyl-CoA carboxylase alpha subunit
MRILIANRGEIARRILRTATRLGHESVAVYADPDRDAPYVAEATAAVQLGPAELEASYLSMDRLLEAASASGATAVHPGYGFLSESARFAEAVVESGLVWIGPHARVRMRGPSSTWDRRSRRAVSRRPPGSRRFLAMTQPRSRPISRRRRSGSATPCW